MLTGHSDCLTRRSCFITQYKTRLFGEFSIRYWENSQFLIGNGSFYHFLCLKYNVIFYNCCDELLSLFKACLLAIVANGTTQS